MLDAHVLIDFRNAAKLRRGVQLVYRDYEDALDKIVQRVIEVIKDLEPRADFVRCRLYGGWHASTGPSQDYHFLTAATRKNFPVRRAGVRVRVEFATAMVAMPGVDIDYTLRYLRRLPRFDILSVDSACLKGSGGCSLTALRHWQQRAGCPESGCPVRDQDAFRRQRQKMVDTALCCDAAYLAQTDQRSWVVLVADDDDMIPGLVLAARWTSRVVQLRPARPDVHYYDSFLSSLGIQLVDW